MKIIIILFCTFFVISNAIGTNLKLGDSKEKTGKEANEAAILSQDQKSEVILLSSLKMDEALCAERPMSNRSFGGQPILISGQKFESGLGTILKLALLTHGLIYLFFWEFIISFYSRVLIIKAIHIYK